MLSAGARGVLGRNPRAVAVECFRPAEHARQFLKRPDDSMHARDHRFRRGAFRVLLEYWYLAEPPCHRRNARQGIRGTRAARSASSDRKSTRLNSSHLVISYAVFCLKKKKKQ